MNSPIVISRAKFLQEKKKIQNKMPLLVKLVSPSSRIVTDILEFHTKSRSSFGLLSSAYLIVQRLSLLELQMNYLKCPYDIQEKISSRVQEKWFKRLVYDLTSTTIIIILMIFGSYRPLQSSFLINLDLWVLASKQIQSL